MTDAVKITAFEAENVKRVKAVQLAPSESGLTVIGGRNDQGKTSVLDAIAWALGGDRYKPDNPKREGSANDPLLHVELSNGIVVERRGKNSSLKVTDPSGRKGGQKLLDGFIEALALDVPKFMGQSDKEKADTLLRIIGVGDELSVLDNELATLEQRRLEIGRIAKQKRGAAEELPFFAEMPAEEISAAELIARQQTILKHNAENQAKRDSLAKINDAIEAKTQRIREIASQIEMLEAQQTAATNELNELQADHQTALVAATNLVDESTAEIEADLESIDQTNEHIRANRRRSIAIADAEDFEAQYKGLDEAIDDKRAERTALLNGAKMPLEGLSVENGRLTYDGQTWDGMSGSGQLKVAAAIIRELNPACGFVLVDKLEQMDAQTLEEFGAWAKAEGLQIIGTRVATDDTCTIIIDDGYARTPDAPTQAPIVEPTVEPFFNFPGSGA